MKHTQSHDASSPVGYVALCGLAQRGRGKVSLSVPMKTVEAMLEAYEDMLDILALDEARHQAGESFPKALVDRLIGGEQALRIYREHRGLTQQALATASGISRDMIAMIETGKKTGSLATVKKLAQALRIEIEDLA